MYGTPLQADAGKRRAFRAAHGALLWRFFERFFKFPFCFLSFPSSFMTIIVSIQEPHCKKCSALAIYATEVGSLF